MRYIKQQSVKEEMQRLAEGARDKVFKAMEELGVAVASACVKRGMVAPGPLSSGLNDEGDLGIRPRSYVAVATLSNSFPTAPLSTLAWSHIRESQVLIDKNPQVSSNPLDMLNKRELVAKANEVVARMMGWVSQELNGVREISAKQLHNGGIICEFDSPGTATWLHNKRTAFVAGFGGTSVVKDKAVMVLIEYVPT